MEPDDVLSKEAQREKEALQATTERLRAERLQMAADNAAIAALIEREERLRQRLQEFLADSQAERQAIEIECARILSAHEIV